MRSFLLVVAFLFTTTLSSSAQTNCASYLTVKSLLNERFGETVQSRGISEDGTLVVEIYGNERTGTWTIVFSNTSGLSCVKYEGVGFTNNNENLPPQGEDM